MLSAKRDKRAAKRFLSKALKVIPTQEPRVINVDKTAAYPTVVEDLPAESVLGKSGKFRQNKYLNNLLEQDQRFIRRLVNPGMGFSSVNTARRKLPGIEMMNMIRQGQIMGVEISLSTQVEFGSPVFGVAA